MLTAISQFLFHWPSRVLSIWSIYAVSTRIRLTESPLRSTLLNDLQNHSRRNSELNDATHTSMSGNKPKRAGLVPKPPPSRSGSLSMQGFTPCAEELAANDLPCDASAVDSNGSSPRSTLRALVAFAWATLAYDIAVI